MSKLLTAILLLAALSWSTFEIFDAHLDQARGRTRHLLQGIVRLKVEHLVRWRRDRLADAEVMRAHAPVMEKLRHCLQGTRDNRLLEELRGYFEALIQQHGYHDVLVVDTGGSIHFRAGATAVDRLTGEIEAAVREAWQHRRATLSDIHLSDAYPQPHLALVAPVFDRQDPVGAVIFLIDARRNLFPLVDSWPTPSQSGESLLVRRDGDQLLYLNDPRHRPGAALGVRLPATGSAGSGAASERDAAAKELDYRGIPVISASLPVPDSSWILGAKMDRAEVDAQGRREALYLASLLVTAVALVACLALLAWQCRSKRHLAVLRGAEMDKLRSLAQFQTLFEQSPDGILLLDGDQRFLDANPAARRMLDQSQAALQSLRLPELLPQLAPGNLPAAVESFQPGASHHLECEHRRPDGATFLSEIDIKVFAPDRCFVILRDITERKRMEDALREREQTLQVVMDTIAEVFWMTDYPFTRVLFVSPAFETIWQRPMHQVCRNPADLITAIHPDDRAIVEAVLARPQPEPFDHEYRIVRPDGSIRWIRDRGYPVVEADGRVRLLAGVAEDITERKHQDLQQKLSQFALESASDLIGWVRPDSSIAYINQSGCRLLGYRLDELQRMTVPDIDGNYGNASWGEHWAALKQAGSLTFESVHRTREGRLIPVEVNANYFVFQGEEYNCAFIRDITQRKAAEKALQTLNQELENRVEQRTAELARSQQRLQVSEERLRLALDGAHLGAWHWDMSSDVIEWSPTALALAGFTPGSQPSRAAWWARIHPEDATRLRQALDRAIASGTDLSQEYRLYWPDGSERWLASTGRVIYDEQSSPLRLEGISSDITERKRAEQAIRDLNANLERKVEERTAQLAAASAAKSQFLAHMSHEIRTPMNAILGFAQILEQDGLAPGQRKLVTKMRQAGDILLNIINDILDFSKIEAGELRIDSQHFSLSSLLNRVMQLLRQQAEAKGLELRVQGDIAAHDSLEGDPLRLEQILINLTSNAVKFTERGAISLTVVTLDNNAGQTRLRFEVRDTGIGIPAEVLARLFQPFTQADASITRRFGGTGLGLSISKRLVELMGGQLGVESELGRGSTFWFELPFARHRTAAASAAPDHPALPSPEGQLRGLRILAVDDNRTNRLLAERALALTGADVMLAVNGEEALEHLRANPEAFDMVLMDIQMPVMDGLAATRAIRQHDALTHLPVIALTAGVLPEERDAALAAGMDDFLTKPLDIQQLTIVLGRYRSGRL
ncbi:hypothetical protein JCM19379_17600 [Methyloparacoccus murrellii]